MSKVPKLQNLEFSIGEMAVYPAHGVGVIERIEQREISGNLMSFYIIRILDNDMTVMIPTSNLQAVGLRHIIPKNRIPKVLAILKKQDVVIDTYTWNRRYREYMEKIKTGSVYEIAGVFRDLNVLKNQKTLSFGERRMLDTARTLLVKELAISKGTTDEEVEKELNKIFTKNAA
jgi:CarD family transcriptional regulator